MLIKAVKSDSEGSIKDLMRKVLDKLPMKIIKIQRYNESEDFK